LIDFRYHLISIVAVLLALSIGIVMGTGVFGGPLLEDLKARVEEVRGQNAELRTEINDLQARVSDQERFAESTQDYLLPGRLRGVEVVVIEFEGVAGGLVDEVRDEVDRAGGVVASTITVTKKFALNDQVDRDQLALAVSSSSSEPADLRRETALALGTRAASVAAPGEPSSATQTRLESLITDLDEGGFLSVSRRTEDETVPPGASFLVLGGGEVTPGYPPDEFATVLTTALARARSGTLAAETTDSKWDIIPSILDDSASRDSVATVGAADKIEGRIAVVLGLTDAIDGTPGHYGSGDGADAVLPTPDASSS
jgi:hypothetical protein